MKTFILTTLLTLSFSITALAKVELFTDKKPAIKPDQVKITTRIEKTAKCEEMGIVHSKAYWGGLSTKKGMLKRMRKHAAKVGANLIFLANTGHDAGSGSNVGNGTIYHCK